jgi:hypothetical protein
MRVPEAGRERGRGLGCGALHFTVEFEAGRHGDDALEDEGEGVGIT